jgi:ribosomal protein S9
MLGKLGGGMVGMLLAYRISVPKALLLAREDDLRDATPEADVSQS